MTDWDSYFLELSRLVSTKSKDPSTKCGCVIVRKDKSIASTGFNGFPKGCDDSPELYNNRSEKYQRIIHSEPNAIILAGEKLTGYTLYVWPMPPCDRCACLIIQAGIKRIVCPAPEEEKLERWKEAFDRAKIMYNEANVELVEVSPRGFQVINFQGQEYVFDSPTR